MNEHDAMSQDEQDQRTAAGSPPQDDATTTWEEVARFLGAAETHGLREPPVRIDTHAAVVFLAGDLAYKIKRPVRFPFLDFSTVALRAAACRREIAVDRPIAPQIYRRVVAVTRRADGGLAIGGDGTPVEWAVEMNRFDETATLDRVLARGPLAGPFVDDLAVAVAKAVARAGRREAAPWIADLAAYLRQNAEAFAARPDLFAPLAAERLERMSRARLADLADLVEARGRLGFVRLGHGDLHSGNIAVIDGRPQPFDAVEFDDAVATGDLLYDAGFLIMDLADRGDAVAACRFLARFLVETARLEADRRIEGGAGDAVRTRAEALIEQIDGLSAVGLFLSIRAALRAKIAAARALHLNGPAALEAEAEARRLFTAAEDHVAPCRPRLVAIGGLSGTGKTTLARAVAPCLGPSPGALVLRTDEIRKLLAGVIASAPLPTEHYTPEATARIYTLIEQAASRALAAGRSVIVDAVSLRPRERAAFAALAARVEVSFTGFWLETSEATALARVGARTGDASDAGADVVRFQRGLGTGPIDWIRIDADGSPEAVAAAARAHLER